MLYLTIAIIAEIIGSTALKAANGFTNLLPSVIGFAGFGVALFFFGLAIKTIPLGIAYAIWSGIGIASLTVIGLFIFKQSVDLPGLVGICLIIAGVLVINTLSSSVH
ncbi:MAG: multidrug efflux SMR transporter [Pseudomonadota bacterium]